VEGIYKYEGTLRDNQSSISKKIGNYYCSIMTRVKLQDIYAYVACDINIDTY